MYTKKTTFLLALAVGLFCLTPVFGEENPNEAELSRIFQQIQEMKATGQDIPADLYDQYFELESVVYPERGVNRDRSLDQGISDCPGSLVIDPDTGPFTWTDYGQTYLFQNTCDGCRNGRDVTFEFRFQVTDQDCVEINTCGSGFDTWLCIYKEEPLGGEEFSTPPTDPDNVEPYREIKSEIMEIKRSISDRQSRGEDVTALEQRLEELYQQLPNRGTDRGNPQHTLDQPTNDLCEDAILLSIPSVTSGSTTEATFDDDVPHCGTALVTAPGVWYKVIGNGNQLTATTCREFYDYDDQISIFESGCDVLTCITGNDDNCSGFNNLHATVTWCSKPEREYLIFVHGFSGATGDFELEIIDGFPCYSCCDAEYLYAYNDDNDEVCGPNTLQSAISQCFQPGTYYIILDGYNHVAQGSYQLNIITFNNDCIPPIPPPPECVDLPEMGDDYPCEVGYIAECGNRFCGNIDALGERDAFRFTTPPGPSWSVHFDCFGDATPNTNVTGGGLNPMLQMWLGVAECQQIGPIWQNLDFDGVEPDPVGTDASIRFGSCIPGGTTLWIVISAQTVPDAYPVPWEFYIDCVPCVIDLASIPATRDVVVDDSNEEQICLSWSYVEDAPGYYIYRQAEDGEWMLIGITDQTEWCERTPGAYRGAYQVYTDPRLRPE